MPRHPSTTRFFVGCNAALLVVLVLSAIRPFDAADWRLENGLVVVALAVLWSTHWKLPFSRISYGLIFLFLTLHEIGAHYTYSEVPLGYWLKDQFGLARNHFDRLVHFSFGLLLAYPIREVFLRVAHVRGMWAYYLPLDVTMAFSMVYELIEWAAAELFGGDLGVAFLGSQGDPWDAQKDMALATVGALCAMSITGLLNFKLDRDFAREWLESLRVKDQRPYGEEEIRRLVGRNARSPKG